MADLRKQLERTSLVQRVQQQEVMAKLQVTDTELRSYYDAHLGEFATVPQVTLREITVNVPTTAQGINVAVDDAAKAKADEVRTKIVAGEPFPRLVLPGETLPTPAAKAPKGPPKGAPGGR